MEHWVIAVLIGLVFGLVIGVKIARDSNRKLPVQGAIAQVFHYLACAGLASMLPFIVAGIVVGLRFLALFGTAVGFLALTAVFLLVYAGFERVSGTPSAAR
jgi:ABC-type Fe3+ transport system permease subunit